MSITAPDLLLALEQRYATKVFDSTKKIPGDVWAAIEASLALTPSSFGLQPWKFIVVDSAELREKLVGASWGQKQVKDASHFVVLTARTDLQPEDIERWMKRLSQVQGVSVDDLSGFSGVIETFTGKMDQEAKQAWNIRQVYIALGQLMASAALLGIDTCPMEGISAADYDDILSLNNSGYTTAVACAIGYRSAEDSSATKKKARYAKDQVIAHI